MPPTCAPVELTVPVEYEFTTCPDDEFPITPPAFGEVAAMTLTNREVVVHANSGHGATLQSACGTQNLMAFLANPTATHDHSCAATIPTAYVLPSTFASAAPLDAKRLAADLAIAPKLPPRRR